MARIEKTVFISYRRTDVYTALAVYENLKNQGYDVFFDYRSISSGDFEQLITSNIRARAHFLLILTPTALDRCNEPGDWLRREIEIAIDEKRNIVPLFFKGFRFGAPSVTEKLTGNLKNLSRYNGLNVHEDYFDEAMDRLRTQYLNIPLETVLHPVSMEVQRVVREEQVAADKALEQIEVVQELVKQNDKKPNLQKAEPILKQKGSVLREFAEGLTLHSGFNFRLVGGMAGGLLIIALLIWGGLQLFQNWPSATAEPTNPTQQTASPTITSSSEPTSTSSATEISNSVTPTLGTTLISDKDGMTLVYIPAGGFTMGSNEGDEDERPVHTVYLDAFWIDRTEVTNAMYARCVQEGGCPEPSNTTYYSAANYANHPVVSMTWNDARNYCSWAERRLPTEAEWEKAARGKNAFIYPWGNDAPNNTLLNYNDAIRDTTEVGRYPEGASPFGALDMAGNVWEWVSSLYQDYPYRADDGREDLSASENRVLRGGTWYNSALSVRSTYRNGNGPMFTPYANIGFRCAMSATQ